MFYESPITMSVDTISNQWSEKVDELVMKEVIRIGITVDKDELIKALEYDRDQYSKGYQDGIIESRWIPTSERLPDMGEKVIVTVDGFREPCILWRGEFGWNNLEVTVNPCDVVAWMPLPKPYEFLDILKGGA